MLVQGSCGISRPLGDAEKMRAYLANGQLAQLQRRLEAPARRPSAAFELARWSEC